jgi:mRNA interferase MazF
LPDVLRGDVWWVALDPTVGAEVQKKRPCLIVQRDAANLTSPTTIVCPLTHASGRRTGITNVLVHSEEAGLREDSIVVCNQVRTVDRRCLGSRIGTIKPETLHAVESGLRAILDL